MPKSNKTPDGRVCHLCVDCDHLINGEKKGVLFWKYEDHPRCKATPRIDLVSGEKHYQYCYSIRSMQYGACGWFEAKKK